MKSLIIIVTASLALSACTEEACTPQDLTRLEAARHAEIAFSCHGYTTTEDAGYPTDCPHMDKINAKYRQKREEWVRCQ